MILVSYRAISLVRTAVQSTSPCGVCVRYDLPCYLRMGSSRVCGASCRGCVEYKRLSTDGSVGLAGTYDNFSGSGGRSSIFGPTKRCGMRSKTGCRLKP